MAKTKQRNSTPNTDPPEQEPINPVLQALASEAERRYVNGYYVFMAAEDALVVLYENGKPTTILNMPHEVAKSLSKVLGNLVTFYEKKTGIKIADIEEIREKLYGK